MVAAGTGLDVIAMRFEIPCPQLSPIGREKCPLLLKGPERQEATVNGDATERTNARLYHVEEAAKILSIGRTKAYELIAEGRLHAIHLGRAVRISSCEVDRFIRSVDRPEHPHRRPTRRQQERPGEETLFDPEPPEAA
jgi:excisionase family DNA binding protein